MIFYLVAERHRYTINAYLETWGTRLIPRISPLSYEQLVQQKKLLAGTYIFSDIERLNPKEAAVAACIGEQLLNGGEGVRLLNHPTHSMRRYELLRTLYERGWNQFNVYRLPENRRPEKFPVFLRGENDHGGNRTPLLNTPDELDNAINELYQKGASREDVLITEFCDTSDETGIFRKYTAFIIGDRIIPRSLFFGQRWMLKSTTSLISDEAMLAEEQKYLETNPHEAELREIFQLAHIEYGRIDYSILNGAIQVWEINTNPNGLYSARIEKEKQVLGLPLTEYLSKQVEEAFNVIDCGASQEVWIPISVYPKAPELTTCERLALYREQLQEWLFKSFLPYPHKLVSFTIANHLLINLRKKPLDYRRKKYLEAWTLFACVTFIKVVDKALKIGNILMEKE